MNLIEIKNKSKSDPSRPPYTSVVDENGRLGCDCKGWTTLKSGKFRECTHTKDIVKKFQLQTEVRGDYQYVKNLSSLKNQGSQKNPQSSTKITVAPSTPRQRVPVKPVTMAYGIKCIDLDTIPDVDPYVDPMLAERFPKGQTIENFLASNEIDAWAMEEKIDGHRVIVAVKDGEVNAWSRPKAGKDPLKRELPGMIVESFKSLANGTYDGELYIPGGMSTDVTATKNVDKLRFVVFDLVRMQGKDTTGLTYDERRELLTAIFQKAVGNSTGKLVYITLAESVKPSAEFRDAIMARNGEGTMLKRRGARYQPGARSRDFIKDKAEGHAEMIITGFEKGELGARSVIKVLNPEDESETTVAAMGGGKELVDEMNKNGLKYIGKRCIIEFQFRTPDGSYRHPHWDRWATEK